MGMYQDKDEGNFDWLVVLVFLGDEVLFCMGFVECGGLIELFWLKFGDVVVMGGVVWLVYYGVDKIWFGLLMLLLKGGCINLILWVVE